MHIISHRGFWQTTKEKNQMEAFRRSFLNGYGTETDIRDYKGALVISHDIANDACITLSDFLVCYKEYTIDLPLALNIKADGLQILLKEQLESFGIHNYFVFDMAVPDALHYIKKGFNVFTRQSEYEQQPSYYEKATGIWLDEFYSHWVNIEVIKHHLVNQKKICIVSPELHGRDYMNEWKDYKDIEKTLNMQNLILCTDYPDKAKEFFDE